MAIFITQGRYTSDAVKGMIAKPEDRREAVEKLCAACGAKLKNFYVTTGEYDFMIITEGDDSTDAVVAGLVVAASGAVSHVTTTRAWAAGEFKRMAERAGEIAGTYKPPG